MAGPPRPSASASPAHETGPSAATRDARLANGARLGPYQVTGFLGSGGMGEVYLARDVRLGREVAVKVLPAHLVSDPARRDLFTREARAASALNHPHIVTVHDVGFEDGRPYITMERIEGRTLRDALAEGRMPTPVLLRLACQIADGLAKAHAAGIVHRDLKPENVMVTGDGLAKVLDFGVAKLGVDHTVSTSAGTTLSETTTRTAGVFGTVGYMSPEQARHERVDFRSDQFSLGAMLYEMAAGRPPFAAATVEATLQAIQERDPEPLERVRPDLPPGLAGVIGRCLAKDRHDRYGSTRVLWQELEALRERVTQPRAAVPSRSPVRWPLVIAGVAVVAASLAAWRWRGPGARPDSLAVLPFGNVPADPATEYLSDGVTEGVIGRLSRMPGVRVMARATVFRYKGQDLDARQVGRRLGVDAVLVGQVQHGPQAVVVRAELVDVASGSRLWGGRLSRSPAEMPALEEDLAREVASQLHGAPAPRTTHAAPDPVGYELYLRGRYFWNKRTDDGLKKALALFEQAAARDPSYAAAYVGMADSLIYLGFYNYLSARAAFPPGREAALRAIALDGELAEAHASLAFIKLLYDWDGPGSEAEFRRALALNPGYPTAHHWYGYYNMVMGRYDEAIRALQQALRLDPLSVPIGVTLASAYQEGGDAERAIAQCRAILEIEPRFSIAHYVLGDAYEDLGRYDDALRAYRTATGGGADANQARVHALAGRHAEARRILEELARAEDGSAPSSVELAAVQLALGDRGRALELLEQGHTERTRELIFVRHDRTYAPLHREPRFQDLIRRIGLWKEG